MRDLDQRITTCTRCARLVEWRAEVSRTRRAAYRDQEYWGLPIPGFGPGDARIAIVGLAPGAHGANRTGRVFTGDRSGDVLTSCMYAAGLADQPTSTGPGDGLELIDARLLCAVRCAPPQNRPSADEQAACHPFLVEELSRLPLQVIVALGQLAWNAAHGALTDLGHPVRPRPRFSHGGSYAAGPVTVLGSYHPSQQNTFTGRLTPDMLTHVLVRAATIAGADGDSG